MKLLYTDAASSGSAALVRFAPGTAFRPHRHPGPEEYLVLDGQLEEDGRTHASGTYVFHPPHVLHGPSSMHGCQLLIPLGSDALVEEVAQSRRDTNGSRYVYPGDSEWMPSADGVFLKTLFFDAATGRMAALVRLAPGASEERHVHPAGEESFVLSGSVEDGGESLGARTYVRYGARTVHRFSSTGGCELVVFRPVLDVTTSGADV